MKKFFIAITLTVAAILAVLPVSATDKEANVANALYSLGLAKGYDDSGSDFRLENSLTRAESIVQIVRFLGAEKEATANTYSIPFDDVPTWAVPYVGYAYTNGITSGRSATKFDPDATVDEAQFLTLLLRAMEYRDLNGDFDWKAPFALAENIKIIERAEAKADFTRGDAFSACFNALSSKCKGGKTLSEKLIDANAFTENSYKYAERIANGETIVVACVGDSVTQGTGSTDASKFSYPAQLQKLLGQGFKVVNCGKASSYVMSTESEHNVKSGNPELWYPNTAAYTNLKKSAADIVIVMLGTNDARSMTTPAAEDDFVSSYKELIEDIAAMESNPEIYLSTMIPAANADITNQNTMSTLPRLIRDIAHDLDLPLVETGETLRDYYYVMLAYNDLVHPNNISYPALATNFYNEVFGHDNALPELPKAENDVVFVSSSGNRNNGGTSVSDAVDTLGLAVAMLRENGGTVVVCGKLAVKTTYLSTCGGNVTITSVYNGVDYREENEARIELGGIITLASDLTIENVTINSAASGKAFTCRYNNFTVGDGVACTGTGDIAINVGYRIASGTLSPEEVSCHKDCTVSVASGTWALLRGGNMRTNAATPIGTIAEGVKVSIYVSGGEFNYVGVNATSAVGMNGCDGDVYMEISGGKFAGGVYGVSRTGSNTSDTSASFGGNITMKVTGGEFEKGIGLYHTADTPKVRGDASLTLSNAVSDIPVFGDFKKILYID